MFASGSQFPSLEISNSPGSSPGSSGRRYPDAAVGKTLVPAQANNCHVFPGLGLGILASARGPNKDVTPQMLLAAAETIAALVGLKEISTETLLPDVSRLGEVALEVAVAVARASAEKEGGSGAGGDSGKQNKGGGYWRERVKQLQFIASNCD